MRHLFTLVLLFSFLTAFSQNNKIDSLQQEVNKAKGTNRILLLNDLALAYWDVDLKKSITLGNEALRLSDQYKFYKAKARTYNIIGGAYVRLDNSNLKYKNKNLSIANNFFNRSIEASKQYGTDIDHMKSLCNIITIYGQGFYDPKRDIKSILEELKIMGLKTKEYRFFGESFKVSLAIQFILKHKTFDTLEYLEQCEKEAGNNQEFIQVINTIYFAYYNFTLQHFKLIERVKLTLKSSKDEYSKIYCYTQLGEVYMYLSRYKESATYYGEALKIIEKSNDPMIKLDKDKIEYYLGSVFVKLKDFKRAYIHLVNALNDNGLVLLETNRCFLYSDLGLTYLEIDSISKAKYYINKSISLSDSTKQNPLLKLTALQAEFKLWHKLGESYNLKKNVAQITKVVDDVSESDVKAESYLQLTDYYKSTGDYKKSLYYLEKWVIVNDSLKSTESLQIFNEFQTKYETEKKEQQIVLQDTQIKSQYRFLIVLSISGILLLMAFVFIYILYNKRNQAYKQLVLQSIGKIDNEELFDDSEILCTDNELEEVTEKITNQKNNNPLFDETTRSQIKEELQKQLADKVYLDESLTINKLATLCNTNRTYLSQVINETYQMNFNTFINKLRIDEAKKLLLDESFETPLKHLSTQLGFNTYTVFNDAFKRFIGVTPAFFLKTIKAERDNNN